MTDKDIHANAQFNEVEVSSREKSLNGDTPDYEPHAEAKIVRKIDWRLLPILGALYSIALIDRVNLGNARVAGMGKDLKLTVGDRYTIALVVFFVPYIIFELPSNLVLRKVGAANWLSFIGFAWGCVMISQAFVKSYKTLAVCRALLGLFEAGFFPGCVYLVSSWYKRYEVQKRLAFFFLLSVLMGGFANILAYGLMQMEGIGGLRGWQWIFIIEGLLTIVVAVLARFLIIDFPDKAEKMGFLTPAETTVVAARIERDRGDYTPDPLTWATLFRHLSDLKLWAFSTIFMSSTMPAYAFAYFLPVMLRGMGYSAGLSNILSAPPVVFAVIVSLTCAYVGDHYRIRAPVVAFQSALCLIGLLLTGLAKSNSMRYFGCFLGNAGAYGNLPAILAYQANNVRLASKRNVSTALTIGFGGIGGIVASTTFTQKDAPKYVRGLWITAGLQFYVFFILCCLSLYFWRKNKQCDEGTLKKPIEGQEGFKYTL